ncbi:MAG: UDP-N-acetylglucosamine 2-epimerase (hydrolyzing), partial [Brevundimonas sp.]
ERTVVAPSLGADRYLQAARLAGAVIGNSSSGVIEAPMVRTPSVDIGERQAGRLNPAGVIHAAFETDAIRAAIRQALDPSMRRTLADTPPPFGDGQAARRIVEVLERTDLTGLARKPFVDR